MRQPLTSRPVWETPNLLNFKKRLLQSIVLSWSKAKRVLFLHSFSTEVASLPGPGGWLSSVFVLRRCQPSTATSDWEWESSQRCLRALIAAAGIFVLIWSLRVNRRLPSLSLYVWTNKQMKETEARTARRQSVRANTAAGCRSIAGLLSASVHRLLSQPSRYKVKETESRTCRTQQGKNTQTLKNSGHYKTSRLLHLPRWFLSVEFILMNKTCHKSNSVISQRETSVLAYKTKTSSQQQRRLRRPVHSFTDVSHSKLPTRSMMEVLYEEKWFVSDVLSSPMKGNGCRRQQREFLMMEKNKIAASGKSSVCCVQRDQQMDTLCFQWHTDWRSSADGSDARSVYVKDFHVSEKSLKRD